MQTSLTSQINAFSHSSLILWCCKWSRFYDSFVKLENVCHEKY